MVQYNEDLNQEIWRTFKNFNKKVGYNATKTKGRGMIPRKVNVKNWKERYSDKSRAEIERQLKLYQSFGKRDALNKQTDSRISKWELEFFRANQAKTEQFYKEEIADLERIVGDQPSYHLRMHDRLTNLKRRYEKLHRNLETLSEDEIKSMRGIYAYAERSELVKRKGFRLYLAQVERTMDALGYSKREINAYLDKYDVLSENEFTEMVRNEDMIDAIYDFIDSPKGRGKYQLMREEKNAKKSIETLMAKTDELIAKYHTEK